MLGWNLGLALVWCALAGDLSTAQLVIGFVVGYLLIGWLIPGDDARTYLRRVPLFFAFAAVYAYEVVASSLAIAWEVITPRPRRAPGIIEVPLDVTGDAQIAMILNAVTFTPGTIAVDLSADRRTMIVHDMFLKDPQAARDRIKRRYERWAVRLLG